MPARMSPHTLPRPGFYSLILILMLILPAIQGMLAQAGTSAPMNSKAPNPALLPAIATQEHATLHPAPQVNAPMQHSLTAPPALMMARFVLALRAANQGRAPQQATLA